MRKRLGNENCPAGAHLDIVHHLGLGPDKEDSRVVTVPVVEKKEGVRHRQA